MTGRLFQKQGKDLLIAIVMLLQILFFIICLVIISSQISVHTDSSQIKGQGTERYKSIQVCPGESLWEISKRYYSSEFKSMDLYMKKIMRLNNMTDGNVNSGANLIIPYYD